MRLKEVVLHDVNGFTMVIPAIDFVNNIACKLDKQNKGYMKEFRLNFRLSEASVLRKGKRRLPNTYTSVSNNLSYINGIDLVYENPRQAKRMFGNIRMTAKNQNRTVLTVYEDNSMSLVVKGAKKEDV